jgi:UDP-GlcNAc:undecaprenyl-phosphate GlcNAc-1-phosphate transferase
MITALMMLFIIALALSLAFTPMVRALGIKLGAMDIPLTRKVHTTPVPRIGGVAVSLSFTFAMVIASLYVNRVSELLVFDQKIAFGLCGALVVFGCGLWDDFCCLNPGIKLFFQIVGATLAFVGGISINGFFMGSYGIQFSALGSYAVTVFWFLLFINAVNLIDGLDGLASGVVFFVCILMIILSTIHGDYFTAFYFTALGGAILGFLKYNFNPASIFLGDGGSYFLGYAVAALSIMGSVKSQVGALVLIPMLALGVPIFDTVLSPLRRFIRGRRIFHPDRGHIHHIFLRMGLSSRNVVLIIYGMTMVLCVLAIIFVNLHNGAGGFVLLILLLAMIFLVRKMGYLEYLAFDKFYGWLQDMTDVAGLSQARRSFLSLQIEMNKSRNVEELWVHIGEALEMLRFDQAELYYCTEPVRCWRSAREIDSSDSFLRIEIPLIDGDPDIFGKLILLKDVKLGHLEPYTIRRVEHLRRTLLSNLTRLKK